MLTNGYPTLEQVEDAFYHEIVIWHESLPIPRTEEDREVMDAIFDRYHDGISNYNW
jgi:hypothetical protein